jgi:hypothetical protein
VQRLSEKKTLMTCGSLPHLWTTQVSARHHDRCRSLPPTRAPAPSPPFIPRLLTPRILLAMTTAAEDDPPFPLLLRLLELPDGFFEKEVLTRLGARDLAWLARVRRGCAAAVAATALMQWAKSEKDLPPRPETLLNPVPLLCWGMACQLATRSGSLAGRCWLTPA